MNTPTSYLTQRVPSDPRDYLTLRTPRTLREGVSAFWLDEAAATRAAV